MAKQSQYEVGRLDGLQLALRIAKTNGIETLEKECKFRGATGINPSLATKGLDKLTEQLKMTLYQTVLIASLSVLHDRFGFGQVRLQRYVDGFAKLTAYLDQGWLYWYDLIEELRKEMDIVMDISSVTADSMGRVYRHPEPEDIYTEDDLIDDKAWRQMLHGLRFSETNDTDGSKWILDENGDKLLHWTTEFERIQVFDTLYGMELAKDHWGIT